MLNINTIARAMESTIDRVKVPAQILPAVLLYCTAIKRPGLSASKIAADIISDNEALGIATGTMPDGSPNVVNQYTYNIVKKVVDAIKEDAVIQAAIPMGSLMIQTNGANAGGPVVGVGTNITNTTIRGIIR